MSQPEIAGAGPPFQEDHLAGFKRHPLLQLRYQLLGGLLLAVGLPFLVRLTIDWQLALSISTRVTVVAAIVAHLVGYTVYKKLDVFPGVATFSTILPAFAIGYGLVFLFIFFLRLDYSRFQAGSSLLISVSWYFGLSIFVRRLESYRLAIVPCGDVERLMRVGGVIWEQLASANTSPGRVQGVVADLRADLPEAWERFITGCVLSGIPVYNVKQILESLTGQVEIEHLSENTLGSLNPNQVYFSVKRTADQFFALVMLVLGSPLLLIIALVIRLESPGPALFRQERMGYRGKTFTLCKFRTMQAVDTRSIDDREKAVTHEGDARITRLGRFLRRTRLDELPQAINVLRGEMSWIGPRPEPAVLSRWYETELQFYRYRYIVLPGVTGWAQVNQGHVNGLEQAHQKLHYDFFYIKNFSPWLDLVIAMRTIRTMLTGFGAK